MSMSNDFRHTLRSLFRAPVFAITVVLLLALGIGANVMIFSVVDYVLFEPLPFPDGDRLVQVWERSTRGDRGSLSAHDVVDLGREAKSLAGVAGYGYTSLTMAGDEGAIRVSGLATTTNFFDVLGMAPVKGRGFREGDDASIAVVSTAFWSRQLGEAGDVVGKTIVLNGRQVQVVGVADDPVAFHGIDVWMPMEMDLDESKRGNHYLFGIARIGGESTPETAAKEIETLGRNLKQRFGDPTTETTFRLVPVREEWFGEMKAPLYVMFAAVAIVLLIVCANVAGLMLARASARGREIAIRTALGAGRGHLVRQFVSEGLVLSLVSGTLGLALAAWGVRQVRGLVPGGSSGNLGIDGSVVAFALLATILAALVFSIAPVVHAMRPDVMSALRLSGSRSETGVRTAGRRVFVAVQFAFAVVLLVSGVLLARSLRDLGTFDPGFEPKGTLTMRMALGDIGAEDLSEVAEVQERILEEIRAIGSVTSAGVVSDLPFSGSRSSSSFQLAGDEEYRTADRRQASAGYFEAMGMTIVEGRGFLPEDDLTRPRVAIVNEKLAASLSSDGSAIGKKIVIGNPEEIELEGAPMEREIVGVVSSIVHDRLGAEPADEFYVSAAQLPSRRLFLVVRSSEGPQTLIPAVREAVRRAAPTVAVYGFQSMSERLATSLRRNAIVAWGVGSFSMLALVLSIVGLYGLVSYLVAQRTREFGVRRALGASTKSIVSKVVGEGLVLAGIGTVAGVAAALVVVRFLQGLLFGVKPHDPLTFGIVVATLGLVTAAACALPASRAASVEVMSALRED